MGELASFDFVDWVKATMLFILVLYWQLTKSYIKLCFLSTETTNAPMLQPPPDRPAQTSKAETSFKIHFKIYISSTLHLNNLFKFKNSFAFSHESLGPTNKTKKYLRFEIQSTWACTNCQITTQFHWEKINLCLHIP